jgi:hypothetical protein
LVFQMVSLNDLESSLASLDNKVLSLAYSSSSFNTRLNGGVLM